MKRILLVFLLVAIWGAAAYVIYKYFGSEVMSFLKSKLSGLL